MLDESEPTIGSNVSLLTQFLLRQVSLSLFSIVLVPASLNHLIILPTMKLSPVLVAAVLVTPALSSLYNESDLNHTCVLRTSCNKGWQYPNLT